jgi:tetratricopeptide (TPR) repeat protein
MDQARYLAMVKDFADGFASPRFETVQSLVIGNHPTHPHLMPLLASAIFLLFDRSVDAAFFTSSLFYAGMIALVFLTADRLAGPRVGLLAAVLAAGQPLLSRFSRFFLLEEAAAFFVILVVYCLLRSNAFSSLRWSAVLGFAVGLGLLIKWTLSVFILPPILLVGVASALRERSWQPLLQMVLSGALATAVSGPWYFTRSVALLDFVRYAEEGRVFAGDGPGVPQLWLYLKLFLLSSGWPLAVVALLGVVCLLRRPSLERVSLFLSIVTPTTIFSFAVATQDLRHLVPAFPVLAVSGALALAQLRPEGLRRAASVAIIVIALLAVHQTAWGLGERDDALFLGRRWALVLPEPRPPDRRDWGFRELLHDVQRDLEARAPTRDRALVRVVAANPPFRPNGFAFLAAQEFPQLHIGMVPFFVAIENPHHVHLGAASLLSTDYFLLRSGDINGNARGMFNYSQAVQRLASRSTRTGWFRTVAQTRLPSGISATAVALSPSRCTASTLDYLDWAHETDPDDPSLLAVVRGCIPARRDGSIWRDLEALFQGSANEDSPLRLTTLEEAVARHPEVRWTRRLLADSLRRVGRLAEAAQHYESIGSGTPYECSPLVRAGQSFRSLDLLEEAKRALTEGVEDWPDCIIGHEELAIVFRALGETESAQLEEELIAALHRRQGSSQGVDAGGPRLRLGELAARAGRIDEALFHLRRGLENEPANGLIPDRLSALTSPRRGDPVGGALQKLP